MIRLFGSVVGLTNQPQGLDVGISGGKKVKQGTFTVSGAAVAVTGLGFTPRVLNIKLNNSYLYYGFTDYSSNNFYGVRNANSVGIANITRDLDGFSIPLDAINFPNGTWQYYAEE